MTLTLFYPLDRVVSKKQETSLARKGESSSGQQKARSTTTVAGCSTEGDGSDNSPHPTSQSESEYSSGEGPASRTRNFLDVTKVAASAIQFGVSNRATSAICIATLAAVKDAVWISAAADVQSVDRHKI